MHEIKGKNIIFEGPDNCGKSFLLKQTFGKNYNKNNFIQDRGMLTSLIYARALNRENVKELEEAFRKDICSNRNMYFVLHTPEEILRSRFNAIGDDRHNFENILKINREYNKLCESTSYRNLTRLFYYDDFITELELRLYEIQSTLSNVFSDVFEAACNAYFNKDLMNYHFNWLFDFDEIFHGVAKNLYVGDVLDYSGRSNCSLIDYNYFAIRDKERFERNKIISDLLFNSHIQISKYGEGLDSRRFISVNDSCFSFLQFIIHRNELYCTAHMRSSNAKNNIFVDVKFLLEVIREFCSFIRNYEFKNLECELKSIHVDLNISSLHYRD